MRKLIPTHRCDREEKSRPAAWTELAQLSDWTLKDIGIIRLPPALDSVKPFWLA